MKIGTRAFKPALLPTLVYLLLLPGLIWLGFWQLEKGSEKQRLRELRKSQSGTELVRFSGAAGDSLKSLLYQKIEIRGHFDLDHQVLLHNQTYKGRPGFLVYAPFRLEQGGDAILVTRGWLPLGRNLQSVPDLPGDRNEMVIRGRVEKTPSVGIKAGMPDAGKLGWPRALTYLDMDWLSREAGFKLEPYTVLQETGEKFGMVRDWKYFVHNAEAMPPEKHFSYAVQWFALAITLTIIFIVVNLKKTGSNEDQGE